jgi:predicted acyltransferase
MAAFPFLQFEPELAISPHLFKLRLMGVLQRIALCYMVASLMYLFLKPHIVYGIGIGLLLLYWALMEWVYVPGYGAGNLDSEAGNLAAYIDRIIIGEKHLWAGAGRLRDPEGLFSTLPAIVTCILGIRAGLILKNTQLNDEQKVLRMLVEGILLLSTGYIWDWSFPINKALWTSSFVLFTAGQAFCALALCYYFIDLKGYRKPAFPFKVYGVNALIVFVMSGLLAKLFALIKIHGSSITGHLYLFFTTWLSPVNASLAYALTWVLAWYLVLLWMYRRNIIVKV